MRRNEIDEAGVCIICGEEIDLADNASFVFTPEKRLCADCAKLHGGIFDAASEEWVVAPQIEWATSESD